MMTGLRAVIAIVAAVPFGIAYADAYAADGPVPATLCELVKQPERFDGKIVGVRGLVKFGFEVFALSADDCDGRKLDGVWLEYGKGPKKQPTIWCCGDLTPRDEPALWKNADFRAFHRYLVAQKRTKGCYEGECLLYSVTATLTGRFEAVKTEPCPGDRESHCCPGGGFGHLGFFCGRLVIQSVSDVVAKPVDR
jgi:hypothetical protein